MLHPILSSPIRDPFSDILNQVAWRAGKSYPASLALFFDANKGLKELTGGKHTFNSAILSPQYQRNADGSYTDVGANPAVDVFDGEKFLRSCGAVENKLTNSVFAGAVSGTPGVAPTGWAFAFSGAQLSVINNEIAIDTLGESLRAVFQQVIDVTANTSYRFSYRCFFDGTLSIQTTCSSAGARFPSGTTATVTLDGVGALTSTIPSEGWHDVVVIYNIGSTSGQGYVRIGIGCEGAVTGSVIISNPQLTATAYPLPYVPTTAAGPVTQPASNATTTNGSWFTLADGSPVWKALDGDVDGVELLTTAQAQCDSGWNVDGESTISGGVLHVYSSAGVGASASIAGIKQVGARYRVQMTFVEPTSGNWQIGNASTEKLFSTVQSGTIVFDLVSVETELRIKRSSACSVKITSISIQRIQPKPCTIGTRVMMGVGSGDLANNTTLSLLRSSTSGAHLSYTERGSSGFGKTNAYDGATYISIFNEWERYAIVRRVVQVAASGLRYRVGYMIEGIHAKIQWSHTGAESTWPVFDGSFDPSTLYRLMLGYNNAYPMWLSRIAVFTDEVDDALIMKALDGMK